VEIIYPENKIIVPYGNEEKLVLLAVRNTSTGQYLKKDWLRYSAQEINIPVAEADPITIESALDQQKTIPYTKEGWVVVFEDGTRLKIKGDDYMRIAKFKANLSPLAVWEAMMETRFGEMQMGCPEEIRHELDLIESRLDEDCAKLASRIIKRERNIDWSISRKDIALQIQNLPDWMHAPLFAKLSGRAAHFLTLKLLRPKGNEFVDISQFEN
jgi:RNA ligase